jgi:hypothetical protein
VSHRQYTALKSLSLPLNHVRGGEELREALALVPQLAALDVSGNAIRRIMGGAGGSARQRPSSSASAASAASEATVPADPAGGRFGALLLSELERDLADHEIHLGEAGRRLGGRVPDEVGKLIRGADAGRDTASWADGASCVDGEKRTKFSGGCTAV